MSLGHSSNGNFAAAPLKGKSRPHPPTFLYDQFCLRVDTERASFFRRTVPRKLHSYEAMMQRPYDETTDRRNPSAGPSDEQRVASFTEDSDSVCQDRVTLGSMVEVMDGGSLS